MSEQKRLVDPIGNFNNLLAIKDKNQTKISMKKFLDELLKIPERDRYVYLWQDPTEKKIKITAIFSNLTYEALLVSTLKTKDNDPFSRVWQNRRIFLNNPTVWYAESQKITKIYNILSGYTEKQLNNARSFFRNQLIGNATDLFPFKTVKVKDEKSGKIRDVEYFNVKSIRYESTISKILKSKKDSKQKGLLDTFKLNLSDVKIESGQVTKIEGAEVDYDLVTTQINVKRHIYLLLLLPKLNAMSNVTFGKDGGKDSSKEFKFILPVELGKAIYDLWFSGTRVGSRVYRTTTEFESWWDDLFLVLYRMTYMSEIKTLDNKYRNDFIPELDKYTGARLVASKTTGVDVVRRRIVQEMIQSNSPLFQKIANRVGKSIATGDYAVDEETIKRLLVAFLRDSISKETDRSKLADLSNKITSTAEKLAKPKTK